jgi:hypothetical protein
LGASNPDPDGWSFDCSIEDLDLGAIKYVRTYTFDRSTKAVHSECKQVSCNEYAIVKVSRFYSATTIGYLTNFAMVVRGTA